MRGCRLLYRDVANIADSSGEFLLMNFFALCARLGGSVCFRFHVLWETTISSWLLSHIHTKRLEFAE